jgi:division protein CdvB (Snf7/Vps24/ESCRT-III family)
MLRVILSTVIFIGLLSLLELAKKPFKTVLEEAVRTIDTVKYRLVNRRKRLEEKDGLMFKEVVRCIKNRQKQRATIIANELSLIRKSIKMVMTLEIALETIKQRLLTARSYGEIASLVSPAVHLTKELQPSLSNLMPEANLEIEESLAELSNLMIESGGLRTEGPGIIMTPEAERIINEAAVIAEKRAKETLPEVPISSVELAEA